MINLIKSSRVYKYIRFKLKYDISYRKISQAKSFYSSKSLKVISEVDTLNLLKNSQKSFIRIGDGEMYCLMNQMKNKTSNNNLCDNFMRDYLRSILRVSDENILIGLLSGPNVTKGIISSSKYPKNLNLFEYIWFRFYPKIFKYIDINSYYGNAAAFKIKTKSDPRYSLFKDIIYNKHLVLIVGMEGLIDPYHEFFSESKKIDYIFTSSYHSHKDWKSVLAKCRNYSNKSLFILSSGFLSKILSIELTNLGYRAIDIGAVPFLYKSID